MKTFKQMQDNVLEWMADQTSTTMRSLVKQAINQAQTGILTAEQYDFMLSASPRSLAVVAGIKQYPMPTDWLQGLYLRNPSTLEYLEEVPSKEIVDITDVLQVEDTTARRYSISTVSNVLNQPTTAGTVTINTSGGSESSSNSVIVQGINSSGERVEETLSSGSSWTTITGSTVFSEIINVIKVGATWTRTITAVMGSTTIITLTSSEFVKQQQMLEFLSEPSVGESLEYRYYRKPIPLVYDNQGSQIPEPFEDILEYDALIKMQGYTRATDIEVQQWTSASSQLKIQLSQTYQQARTLNARARRIKYNERL